ncbi:MAG: hypothetical protein J6M12_04475 [Clostridia bacterium]|nr:hypothetical protein [Clostridia bacterium]
MSQERDSRRKGRALKKAVGAQTERSRDGFTIGAGIKKHEKTMHGSLCGSLMQAIALTPYIGCENAAKTAKKAFWENISLKKPARSLNSRPQRA